MKGGGATKAMRSGSKSGLDGILPAEIRFLNGNKKNSNAIPPVAPPPHMAKPSGNITRQKMSKKQVHETIKRFQTTIGGDKS